MDLHAALLKLVEESTLFETAVELTSCANVPDQIGHVEPAEGSRLEIEESTLLAIRPDGYIGLRSDRGHLAALQRYAGFLQTGHR